jgi:pyruvate,water dikinase
MCWYLWTRLGELAARRAWYRLGLLPRSMVYIPEDNNEIALAPFFGRQAANVDRLATLMGALPGASRQDVELSFLGTTRDTAPSDQPPRWRTPFVLAKGPSVLLGQARLAARLHADHLAWWQRAIFAGGSVSGPALLAEATDRFDSAMYLHARGRFLSSAMQGVVAKLAESVGRAELTGAVTSGLGQVAESAIADDLWLMSRGQLAEDEFLRRHGFHGTNEGNVSGVSWRMDATPLRGIGKTMAGRPDRERPATRARAAGERGRAVRAELRAALPVARRPLAGTAFSLAAGQVRAVEHSKACFLMAIDAFRVAIAQIGADLVARGRLTEPADAVFLTPPELLDPNPGDLRELAEFRRARRDEYRGMRLPATFVGMPEPETTPETPPSPADELTGACGCPGTVEGVARVITDIAAADELAPGEILVCHYTDPAWVAAMALAEALVIDVGAPGSHGAIVARELGIPCVIGTANGTSQIRTGDHIHVDGSLGRVRVLGRA